jgi:hypothetical protein
VAVVDAGCEFGFDFVLEEAIARITVLTAFIACLEWNTSIVL